MVEQSSEILGQLTIKNKVFMLTSWSIYVQPVSAEPVNSLFWRLVVWNPLLEEAAKTYHYILVILGNDMNNKYRLLP